MEKIRISYACFMNQSGFSFAAQNYILALHQTNQFDIKLHIFGDKPSRPAISDDKYELFMGMARKKDDPDRILIYHCIPNIQRRVVPNKRNIGFATFETFQPPDSWVNILNQNDAIIVPSEFNKKIFSHMDIHKQIYYIPHCIDFNVYNRRVKKLKEYDKFTFLFMGTWRERKGYEQLFEAWLREFKESDNVQLVVKTDRPNKAKEYLSTLQKQIGINKGIAPVFFENKVFDEKILPQFIASSDCLISPTMGEGFGYSGLQCMALGIPVIITDFSGCQDYAINITATLLKPNGFIHRSDMDRIPQFKNKKWAFIEVQRIRRAMRHVYNDYDLVKLKSHLAYNWVRERFSYEEIGKMFINMIRDLYG